MQCELRSARIRHAASHGHGSRNPLFGDDIGRKKLENIQIESHIPTPLRNNHFIGGETRSNQGVPNCVPNFFYNHAKG